jgi:hypothetical protein
MLAMPSLLRCGILHVFSTTNLNAMTLHWSLFVVASLLQGMANSAIPVFVANEPPQDQP